MFKKLQNLLFEDEEEIIEEDVSEPEETPGSQYQETPQTVQPSQPAPIAEPVMSQPVSEPIQPVFPQEPDFMAEQPLPAMQRIDVTQPIPTAEPRQARNDSVFRNDIMDALKPSSLGITADDTFSAPSKPKQAKPTRPEKPVEKPVERRERVGYQFQPVISPIFGVDEKDLNALKTTTTRISEKERIKIDSKVSPILSPMYGANAEDIPSSIQKSVEKSNAQEELRATPEKIAAEDEIPEFSLDDILRGREEEEAEIKTEMKSSEDSLDYAAPLFPDLNLWDDEPENTDDATVVMPRSLDED